MKLRLLYLSLLILTTANAQYSNYYNIDVNKRVDASISGQITVNKNISTIDYGQLALANAEREKTRLESIKYTDEQKRRVSLEVAANPIKAFDYGFQNSFKVKGQDARNSGFRKFTISFRIPHNSLFVQAGAGRYENVSTNGITTEIVINPPAYNIDNIEVDIEKLGQMENVKVGELNEKLGPNGDAIFVHKKDLNRATVYGLKGFKYSLIWEDDYQYTITDNYSSIDKTIGNGVRYFVQVRFYGDKDEVTFEQLEGRRFYLKRLVEKVISTAIVTNMKY